MSIGGLKVLIVDDEPLARNYIREMLVREADVEVVAEAGDGKVAAWMIAKHRPDLMFLDIQMPEMNGFELLDSLSSDEIPVTIFTTAYEEFALRAFEVHALDYLLKPFDEERFRQALKHAVGTMREPISKGQESDQIAELLKSLREKKAFLERFLVKKNGRIVFLKVSDISWIKADDKYIHLHAEKDRHMIRQTLSSIRLQLDPTRFVQLNRSVIVNIDSIKEFHTMFNGDHEVQLHDGTKFTLSRNHKNELFELLGKPFT